MQIILCLYAYFMFVDKYFNIRYAIMVTVGFVFASL